MFELGAWNLGVRSLRASGFELRLRLRHVDVRSNSLVEPILGQIQRLLVAADLGIEQLFFPSSPRN